MPTPRVTIDELPEQTVVEDANFLIVQDAGVSKKMAVSTLMASTGTDAALQDHLVDTSDAHDASAISATASSATVTGTSVQAQLGQVATEITSHVADTSGAHAASAISAVPSALIAGTTVQDQLVSINNALSTVGGGGGGSAVGFMTRTALDTLADNSELTVGLQIVVTDATPFPVLCVATAVDSYIELFTASQYSALPPLLGTPTIAEENALTGYASASWNVTGAGDLGALGFTTTMSVRAGNPIDFKIHTGGVGYSLEIIRLGWYGGLGARLIATMSGRPGVTQPNGTLRSTGEGGVGSRDCTNWTVTDTWTPSTDVCHGVYLGVIKRTGQSTFAHVGPFVVTNTRSDSADIMVKLSDMTWRAYNSFGTVADPTNGKSLYGTGSGTFSQGARAWDVSYNTPLVTGAGVPQTTYWNGERPVHAFLERNGYDVAYTTCLDVDGDSTILLGRQVIMSVGHDEYWTSNMRAAWDGAIAAGANAIVMSGNTMLWRTRMVGRVMVCYKDSHSGDGAGVGSDPVTWTGTWRDTRWPARRGENESIGTVFVANAMRNDAISVPFAYKTEPIWRNTTVASLVSGSEALKAACLGFEWDTFEPSYANTLSYPPAIKFLSSTSVNLTNFASNENGSSYTSTINPALHYIVAFKRGSALVVNFGTNQWGWGLNDLHVRGAAGENTTMKQATVNLLADMGCQPATLQSGLTAATLTAWTVPTLSSLSIPPTLSVNVANTSQLAATAVWSNSITTNLADYATWTTTDASVATVKEGLVTGIAAGTATITATYGATSDTCTVTVAASAPIADTFLPATYAHTGTLFSDGAITIGTKFRKVTSGTAYVTGVRYWRSTVNQTTAPVAYLGVQGGAQLATKTGTTGTGAPGWYTFTFDTPVSIGSGINYLCWVWLPQGGYYASSGYFATNKLSQFGLFDSNGPNAGVYKQPPGASPDTTQPTSFFGNNFYLVEPIVTADVVVTDPGDPTGVTVTPATVSVVEAATTQLASEVAWENIAPTDETAFTTWVSGTPANATVSSTGLVTGVADGSATITGTYSGFSDTCVVTITNPVASYTHVWTGATPTAATDSSAYNMGTYFSLFSAKTLVGIRIWNPGLVTPQGGQNRQAHLWTATGITGAGAVLQRTIDIPDLMTAGWSEHLFSTPYSGVTGTYYCVSYFVDGGATAGTSDYGAVANGLVSDVDTAAVRFSANGGRFTAGGTPGSAIPATGSNAFYGVDILYEP